MLLVEHQNQPNTSNVSCPNPRPPHSESVCFSLRVCHPGNGPPQAPGWSRHWSGRLALPCLSLPPCIQFTSESGTSHLPTTWFPCHPGTGDWSPVLTTAASLTCTGPRPPSSAGPRRARAASLISRHAVSGPPLPAQPAHPSLCRGHSQTRCCHALSPPARPGPPPGLLGSVPTTASGPRSYYFLSPSPSSLTSPTSLASLRSLLKLPFLREPPPRRHTP